MRITELHRRLATQAQHFSLIRSMTHVGNISNHFDAMHHLLSGHAGAPADAPYLGSIVSRVRSSERNIADYVWLIRCVGDPVFCAPNIGGGGHLGPQHACSSSAPRTTTRRCPTSVPPTRCNPWPNRIASTGAAVSSPAWRPRPARRPAP